MKSKFKNMITVNLCNWEIAYDLSCKYKQIKKLQTNKKQTSESINLKIDINKR
jgi:hypothetical protein